MKFVIKRFFLCCLLLLLLVLFSVFLIIQEDKTVLGIKTLSDSEYNEIQNEYLYTDNFDVKLLLNGYRAPIDKKTKNIYVSINEKTKNMARFSVDEFNFKLYFEPEVSYSLIFSEMSQNKKHKLIVVDKDSNLYTEYYVIFTNFPVISLNSEESGIDDEGQEELKGEIFFWDALDKETNLYKSFNIQSLWHTKGQTVAAMPKKSLKLSIKNARGSKENVSFCGLGEDDDWILNAMYMDDLKFREKLLMDIWNQICIDNSENIIMSNGEYVELINDSEYQGLYLIQRRVDKKYLKLQDDILVKGKKVYGDLKSGDKYEIIHSIYNNEKTYDFLDENYTLNECFAENINLDNWVDVNLIMAFGALADNYSTNNNFTLFQNVHDDFEVKYILRDTDMSFGLTWVNSFEYLPDDMINEIKNRSERKALKKIYENLDTKIFIRWTELRNSVLNYDNIIGIANLHYSNLLNNGVLIRDFEKNGIRYENKDTFENFSLFVQNRLNVLDEYYCSKK